MSNGTRDSRRAPSGTRSSQHISSIAHLFFDNSQEAEGQEQAIPERHVLVVGTGLDTCAPYAVAGLGHHLLDQSDKLESRGETASALPKRQVFFGEPSPVCFSALSHLEESTYRTPRQGEPVPWGRTTSVSGAILRLFPSAVPSEDFSGGMVEGRFYLRHLDLPREVELQALEAQLMAGQTPALANDGKDALLWCVRSASAGSLALTGRLGRLLRIVQPRKIHLLVFGGSVPGKSGTQADHSSAQERKTLENCRRLVQYVSGDLEVDYRLMPVSTRARSVQLSSLARQLSFL